MRQECDRQPMSYVYFFQAGSFDLAHTDTCHAQASILAFVRAVELQTESQVGGLKLCTSVSNSCCLLGAFSTYGFCAPGGGLRCKAGM